MALNEATNNEDIQRGAALREEQNKARSLMKAGTYQKVAGKAMRATGSAVNAAGRGIRKGGEGMMKAGARLSGTGVGAIAGVPLMALGGVTAGAGLGTQAAGKTVSGVGRGVEKGGRTAKLRAALQEKKNAAALQKQNEEGEGMISGAAQGATGGLLKSAWINLIPSWGLTLVWINIHVFLSWILPSFFCKLGREWIPKSLSKFAGKSTVMLEIGETIMFIILDLIAAGIILLVIVILVQTVQAVTNQGSTANSVLSAISPAFGLASALYQAAK